MKSNYNGAKPKLFVLTTCLLGLTSLHCASTRKLPTLTKQPDCATSIEGYYEYRNHWSGKKPALIIRKDYEFDILFGQVISQTDKGVTFDPDREGVFYDPKPEFFPFTLLEAFIDQNGRVIAGAIPAKLSKAISLEVHLKAKNVSETKPYKLLLKPNESFGYCIPSGVYHVSAIRFVDKEGNVDIGVNYPILEIQIEKGRSNYIGHLLLGHSPIAVRDSVLIPFKIGSRPRGAMAAGILGGAIGGALHAASLAAKGVVGEHKLYLGAVTNHSARGKSPTKYSLIRRLQ